jgi:ATP-dependent Lhr-like helicase
VRTLLQSRGALFFFELQQATNLGSHALRDALRELVVAGLVTNDTVDALSHVARWRPLFADRKSSDPDPTRWLPADFVPSANRPVVQRRVNVRRLPKWKRPDREGGDAPWPGRWSLLDRSPLPQGHSDQMVASLATIVATQWLERYGVVTRDWWRRERPAIPWRAIYRELRRMEMRGDVRRGYFVQGLAGAQFALPSAVEQLRGAAGATEEDQLIVIAASDPANVWALQVTSEPGGPPDTFARPRGARALLVLRGGRVVMTSDAHGRAIAVRPDLTPEVVSDAVRALVRHITARRTRDVIVETIDGESATTSHKSNAFIAAGLHLTTAGLRYYASLDRG